MGKAHPIRCEATMEATTINGEIYETDEATKVLFSVAPEEFVLLRNVMNLEEIIERLSVKKFTMYECNVIALWFDEMDRNLSDKWRRKFNMEWKLGSCEMKFLQIKFKNENLSVIEVKFPQKSPLFLIYEQENYILIEKKHLTEYEIVRHKSKKSSTKSKSSYMRIVSGGLPSLGKHRR
jgi:hypothetical protein